MQAQEIFIRMHICLHHSPFYHLLSFNQSSTFVPLNATSYLFSKFVFQASQMMHLAGQLRIRATELESEAWACFNVALAG